MSKAVDSLKRLTREHPRIASTVVAFLAACLLYYVFFAADGRTSFQTVPLERGDLNVTITATGTLEPEEVVDVGAQIAGQISSFGLDKSGKPIDYRSEVEAGMLLAKIDDVLYKAELLQAQAQLKRARADVLQMQAKLDQAERDWQRAQKLGPSDALSSSAYDAYRAGNDVAKANLAVAEAEVTQAEAQVARAERNLTYCTITSPVKGVVIDRRVNIGQTVVASLNAPSLFLIAKDLTRMQVWVSVNEADIGKIRPGQPVTFTVDAFPGEQFSGEVIKVRLNATMSQNVVTYIVEVATDNSDGLLLPYITANVSFEVTRRQGVWLVPNAALRWAPAAARQNAPRTPTVPSAAPQPIRKKIWIRDGREIRPLDVTVGDTDGLRSEVQGAGLEEGMEVVIGIQEAAQSSHRQEAVNPFAPTIPRGARRG